MGQNTEKKGYKDTLNLPKTSFSMKANLQQREPETLKGWEAKDIYKEIMSKRKDAPRSFILHDGPPYANGHIHMGHVLNKILKDICVKYFTMNGYYAPYVPGWDCHGLPVEHQLFKELNIEKHEIDQVKFRKKAYKYAMKFVKIQAKEFKRLGIFGDWDDPYLTLTKGYEADILDALADLHEKGYIYKDLKPVNWCSKCETALAEAEVEYEDKTSPSIFVKFKSDVDLEGKDTYFIIWTTTPWTLLANVAVAIHPDAKYSVVDSGGQNWVLATDLAASLMSRLGREEVRTVCEMTGTELSGKIDNARHPFIDRKSKIVLADYVTMEDGTGCVHTAPGHGQDDYLTGKKYGLPVIMPVDNKGRFMEEAGEFAGREVRAANKDIIAKLETEGSLVFTEGIKHSYPHCWRCKEAIIFRATDQWFMSIDHDSLRDKLMDAIENDVEWIPRAGKDRIGAMVKMRPDWCLSRQRYWGVPIPAFQCTECGEAFTESGVIRKVAELTRKHGADVWFERPVEEFLPEGSLCSKCGGTEFGKEDDILDVWFDSGVSHRSVLDARSELRSPADMYLEGSDQHRGWFQAALITSMGIKGEAPYKKVLTHGFVVDGEGKKMSKSIGNVISPEDVMKKYGADILRLWVSSSDYDGDIKLSDEILERLADGYRKIRNTFRFLLSNLYDFDPEEDAIDEEKIEEIDKWMLSRLHSVVKEVNGYYDKWEFYRVYRTVYNFCVYEISSVYLDVMKDVLYVEAPASRRRRAAQTVIFNILRVLVRLMAPVICFTSEEAWAHVPAFAGKEESVHLSSWPNIGDIAGEELAELDDKWRELLKIRDVVLKLLEVKREEGMIGSSLEASIKLAGADEGLSRFLREAEPLLAMLFKVSRASVVEGSSGMENVGDMPLSVKIEKASGEKCPRCWNYSDTVGKDPDSPELCSRCSNAVREITGA